MDLHVYCGSSWIVEVDQLKQVNIVLDPWHSVTRADVIDMLLQLMLLACYFAFILQLTEYPAVHPG